jgi:hypothetical protein
MRSRLCSSGRQNRYRFQIHLSVGLFNRMVRRAPVNRARPAALSTGVRTNSVGSNVQGKSVPFILRSSGESTASSPFTVKSSRLNAGNKLPRSGWLLLPRRRPGTGIAHPPAAVKADAPSNLRFRPRQTHARSICSLHPRSSTVRMSARPENDKRVRPLKGRIDHPYPYRREKSIHTRPGGLSVYTAGHG